MKVTNTLTGQKEEFKPRGNVVGIYVCGVTTYDDCHVGHAMSYIIFDAIRRYLEYKGYEVKYVQNFTDIDDKIINRARELGIPPLELASKYISQYFVDMDALNIKRANFYPKVSEEITRIIEMIKVLIEKGHAYESRGSVYFRVKSFPEYGKLSKQNIEEMVSKASLEKGEKEHPLDFALWKAAKPDEPFWSSPWSQGRPGWHIECSTMSLNYLGQNLDIHGGGQDLIFPHHENEIAQSESFTGVVPFARYWLHNGLMQFGKEKMSKSLGNLITVKEAIQHYSPDAIRLFILSSHYRNPLTYSDEALEAAEKGIERLRKTVKGEGGNIEGIGFGSEPFKQRFVEVMDDDFNTAQAVGVLFELVREINRAREEGLNVIESCRELKELASVLGFTLEEREIPTLELKAAIEIYASLSDELRKAKQWLTSQTQKKIDDLDKTSRRGSEPVLVSEDLVELLISTRAELRQAKQWQLADNIRSRLAELGIALEDTSKGTVWKYLH